MGRAERVEEFACMAVELKQRRAVFVRSHFDVMPREPAAPARAERFESSLLRGEARGVVLRGRVFAARIAVCALSFGEDALAKARRAREHFTHAADFDNVYAYGDDHA